MSDERKRYEFSLTIIGETQSSTEIGAKMNLQSMIRGAIASNINTTTVDSLQVEIGELE